ncbi:hypothetical protein AIOL_004563 [Candidatus Rhodobacter oscarellae]|uniref:DUF1501 domain-containing protein n=1 Tax=Candidatus Rhodobacter oscarellae TaxID=1675527 RepID=A0A0J9EAC4_9RHOB|nr:DUF1501 domain-containing protein [Candidatus Rhodobacter lobularis]KMW59581.1 hypothetical protein AIOL_004563 [Candidatus Rhodobacter lobularis]
MDISRRGLLLGACSAAAHPLMTSVTLAAAPTDARLIVIVLRGGMDGLDVVRPVGDPLYQRYRPTLAQPGLDLTGYFALHPGLAELMPLWRRGQLGFAHAVSTPYRDKRSHFDGQDLLEAGTPAMGDGRARGGWLNRLVGAMPGASVELAFGVGNDELRILGGESPVSRWSPEVEVDLTPAAEDLFRHIYAPDPLFARAADKGMALAAAIEKSALPPLPNGARRDPVAAFAAQQLLDQTRIAAFSVGGWDTHQRQSRGIAGALGKLTGAILSLEDGLGPGIWGKTMVLAMTEFGRTVAENGTKGTDHGTAGALIMAGGALRGGAVYGDWPGLGEAALYKRRDLMPTADVRSYCAYAMRDLMGVGNTALETQIFPGLSLEADPRITL